MSDQVDYEALAESILRGEEKWALSPVGVYILEKYQEDAGEIDAMQKDLQSLKQQIETLQRGLVHIEASVLQLRSSLHRYKRDLTTELQKT